MDISSTLKLAMSLSGLTQDQLARELGVTFATLNSWINKRSTPRRRTQMRIESFLSDVLGAKVLDGDSLAIKKDIIARRASGINILRLILNRKDLLDQFVLSLTYNTNSIEGSTLTEADTAAVLFDDIALSNRTLTEQMEAKNHRAALIWLFEHVIKSKRINEDFILKLHAMLMNSIREDAGHYRAHGVRIVGTNIPTANYIKVPELMKELVVDINKNLSDVMAHVANIHARFEQIHPFSDGNGRIGRLLIQAMLLRRNIVPAIIQKKRKKFYLKYLNAAQRKGIFLDLEEFLCDAVLHGYVFIKQGS